MNRYQLTKIICNDSIPLETYKDKCSQGHISLYKVGQLEISTNTRVGEEVSYMVYFKGSPLSMNKQIVIDLLNLCICRQIEEEKYEV